MAFGSVVEFDGVVAFGAATGVLRGREGDCPAVLLDALAAGGCDVVTRAKSSRMLRAASQPDRSNSATTTVCLIRLLIVIPAYRKILQKNP